KHVDAIILGSSFIVLGIFKLFFAILTRYPHWKIISLGGVMSILLGSFFFVQWGSHKHWVVPLLFGCVFILMGGGAVSNAWMLRHTRLFAEKQGADIVALDYFLRYYVSPRYRPAFSHLPSPHKAAAEIKNMTKKCRPGTSELLLRVWLPAECAESYIPPEGKIPVLSRYLLVRDKKGCVTVGHSSLQLDPDIYISHTDKQWYDKIMNNKYDDKDEDLSVLDQLKAHDEEGVFFGSYEEEAKYWMPATRTIKVSRFNERYLRLFESFYKKDSTYNLAVRNCSVCIAMSLDIALLGELGGSNMVLRFLRLIFDKDLWVAAFIRKRAEDMAWSPGLVHDYAMAMNSLIERHSGPVRTSR
ncbi:MAG TPA: hypothetical protein PKY78_08705, partial [Candidatus Omnitrophota bacterium]|nr:hypothetical protein [Candidatus Omnitrophota bacterium]